HGSPPARNLGLLALAVGRYSQNRRPETLPHLDQLLLVDAQELAGQVHQALLMTPDRAVAERDGPHPLDQREALILPEPAAQASGVFLEPVTPLLFRLGGRWAL